MRIYHDELRALMGPVDTSLKLKLEAQLSGIMMVGLQGSGKTTTTGKLASWLLNEGASRCSWRRTSTVRPPWTSSRCSVSD